MANSYGTEEPQFNLLRSYLYKFSPQFTPLFTITNIWLNEHFMI